MRSTSCPPLARAAAAQKRAAAALPRWRSPVGEGANLPRYMARGAYNALGYAAAREAGAAKTRFHTG